MKKIIRVSQVQQLSGFLVRQELLGVEHRFNVEGARAYLRLPAFAGVRPIGSNAAYQAVEWYGDEPGDPSTTWYQVTSCESGLLVDWHDEDLPLLRTPRSEPKRQSLQSTANALMPKIWPAWARSLFWASQLYEIYAAPETAARDVRGGYGLHVNEDGERLNSLGYVLVLNGGAKLKTETWKTMQDAFDRAETPPLWFNYLFDSYKSLDAGNATSAVISAAVACETAIRGLFWKTSSGVTHPTAVRIIDNVPVQQILGRWSELTGMSKQDTELVGKSKVHKVFELRNLAMHYGTTIHDAAEVRNLLTSVKSFIIDTDARISALSAAHHTAGEIALSPTAA